MTVRRRRLPTTPIKLDEVIKSGTSPSGSGAEQSAPVTSRRRKRGSVGGFVSKLDAPLREGETRRWVNDDGNRIAECRELGYEFVSEKGIQTADPGSRISRLVGTKADGKPLHAYLMETPNELFAEGQSEREAANRLIDEAITAGRDSTGRMDEHQYGQGSIKSDR
jgi:hypothetical protein